MKDPACAFGCRRGFSVLRKAPGRNRGQVPCGTREVRLPISALLARIRKLIPRRNDGHHEEIMLGNGALRTPVTPMSDGELGRAIAEFLKDAPSTKTVSDLGRRINPSSRV